MARPKKKNADYFSHDADMRNDPKIKALRRKFGFEGYSIWNMFLEVLTDSDYFEYEWDELNIELLAGDFDIEPSNLKEVIDYCLSLKLLYKNSGKIYSIKLKERFEGLISKRNRDKNRYNKELPTTEIKNKEVSASEKPQSKVKESKVNNIDTNVSKYSKEVFVLDWNELRQKHLGKPSFLANINSYDYAEFKELIKSYSRQQFREALTGLFKQQKLPNGNTTMQSNPKHFLTHFNSYLSAYHDKNTKLYGELEVN